MLPRQNICGRQFSTFWHHPNSALALNLFSTGYFSLTSGSQWPPFKFLFESEVLEKSNYNFGVTTGMLFLIER